MKPLYIIGAGGFGREVAWLVERINAVEPTWSLGGFIDDNPEVIGANVGGYPVIGGIDAFNTFDEEVWAVCAIGSAKVRKAVIEKASAFHNVRFATLIDPSVLMSERVEIGEGGIICAGTVITVDINIGCHVIINLDCTVGHDAVLEDFVTLYPSANVSGNTRLCTGAELGTGSCIIQGKTIGAGTIVGAGAVVIKDLPARCTAVGIPASPIKFQE